MANINYNTQFVIPPYVVLGGILSLPWLFRSLCTVTDFLAVADRREILHGGSATYRTGLLRFLGIDGGMADGRQQRPYGGICFLLKHLRSVFSQWGDNYI